MRVPVLDGIVRRSDLLRHGDDAKFAAAWLASLLVVR
jgi:hypothetical protein